MSYFTSTQRLIERWQKRGLIDGETADLLRDDINSDSLGFNLGAVLATLGGVLLSVAVILLVAANWEYMPRLSRVGLIFLIIWVSYLLGAWRVSRDDRIWSTALYLLGAASFGAGIALISQMYHISGDESQAIAIWSAGVFISAFLLRSSVLSTMAMLIALYYFKLIVFDDEAELFGFGYLVLGPVIALIGILSARFTQSQVTAHLVILFSIFWFCICYVESNNEGYLWGLAFIGAVGFLANKIAPEQLRLVTQIPDAVAFYGVFCILLILTIFQFEYSVFQYDVDYQTLFYGVLILLVSVLALVMHGRDNSKLRWLVYFWFSAEVLYIASVTIGTMISTSGFFLTAGVLVLLLASLVGRFEKRMKKKINLEAGK